MTMDLQSILNAARALGPVLVALPDVRAIFDAAVAALSTADQDVAKAELAKLRDENDALHERLQVKLANAAKRD